MGTFPGTPTTRGKYAELENHGRPLSLYIVGCL